MFDKILKSFYNAALIMLFTMANVLIITSVLFLCHLSISYFHLPIAFVLSLIELYFIKKENYKYILISVLLVIVIFIVSLTLCGRIMDTSYDGNAYHKEAIGMLKEGWNPIYSSAKSFGKTIDYDAHHSIWTENYPKASWIIGASIYKITNNIETAKVFNILILFIVFFIIAYLVNKYYKNKLLTILMPIAACTLPIIWEQIFSLYLDGFLGFILLLLIIYMYLVIKENDREYFWVIGCLLIIIINLKFSGLLYAGLFCLGYYIVYLIKKLKSKEYKELLHLTLKFIIILFVSLFIVGSNSYVRNVVVHHNPLYPLIGKDKKDIMTGLQPESFDTKSPIEKNFYAIFSYSENIGKFNHSEPRLKRPFIKTYYEQTQITEDIRIGGHGVYFSGILIIALLIIIVYFIILIVKKEYDDLIMLGIPFAIIILGLFIIGESWWARYYPQMYFIPLMAIFILLKNKHYLVSCFGIVLLILTMANLYYTTKPMLINKLPISGQTRMNLEANRGKTLNIKLEIDNFSGALFNLKDYKINYKIVQNLKDKKEIYLGKIECEVKK